MIVVLLAVVCIRAYIGPGTPFPNINAFTILLLFAVVWDAAFYNAISRR
jgi:hypothetical protein